MGVAALWCGSTHDNRSTVVEVGGLLSRNDVPPVSQSSQTQSMVRGTSSQSQSHSHSAQVRVRVRAWDRLSESQSSNEGQTESQRAGVRIPFINAGINLGSKQTPLVGQCTVAPRSEEGAAWSRCSACWRWQTDDELRSSALVRSTQTGIVSGA